MWDIRQAALNRYGKYVGKRPDYALCSADNDRRRLIAEASTDGRASRDVFSLGNVELPPLPVRSSDEARSASENGAVSNAVGVARLPSRSSNVDENAANVDAGGQQGNGDNAQSGQFVFNDNLDDGVRLITKLQHDGAPLYESILGTATRSRRKAVKVLCIARCPLGGHFVTGADDGICRVWSEEDGEAIAIADSERAGNASQSGQRTYERRSTRVQQQTEGT